MHTRFTKWDKLIILFVVDKKKCLLIAFFYRETKELIMNNNPRTLSAFLTETVWIV